MGAADVVPGVSGGTMAMVLGIYEELIDATRKLTSAEFLQPLVRLRLMEALRVLPLSFLAAVLSGILVAIFSLASFLHWGLENYPVLIWAFFLGLVLASIIVVALRLPAWRFGTTALAVAGAVAAYLLVGLVPVQTPETWWFYILSGAIASTAMLLPGVSGSFMLVLLGKYQRVLGAVSDRELLIVGLVGIGAGLGIILFARVLAWLLHHYPNRTIAVLIGLMAGSLRKLWPWKEILETTLDRHGDIVPLIEQNVLPMANAESAYAALLAIGGFAAVLLLYRVAGGDSSSAEP